MGAVSFPFSRRLSLARCLGLSHGGTWPLKDRKDRKGGESADGGGPLQPQARAAPQGPGARPGTSEVAAAGLARPTPARQGKPGGGRKAGRASPIGGRGGRRRCAALDGQLWRAVGEACQRLCPLKGRAWPSAVCHSRGPAAAGRRRIRTCRRRTKRGCGGRHGPRLRSRGRGSKLRTVRGPLELRWRAGTRRLVRLGCAENALAKRTVL